MAVCAYIDGEFLTRESALLPTSDLALQRGYGVFDFFTFRSGRFFQVDQHLSRLRNSAKALHLQIHLSDEQIVEICEKLVSSSNFSVPAVRIFVTGGDDGSFLSKPRIVMIVEECPECQPEVYEKGISLVSAEFQRELPEVKSINYINSIRLGPWIRSKSADDVLYSSDGIVSECPRSNFFAFFGDKLLTPKRNILMGVTRACVLEIANKYFQVEEVDLSLKSLDESEEAFVTSSSKKILPVVQLNSRKIGRGRVGERTKVLMKEFEHNLLKAPV